MTSTGPGVVLQHVSPMVYLDHWALMMFSADASLASRLTKALCSSGGTLVLSWLNLGEYATVSDPAQRREVQQLVEGALPAIFCIDVDLAAVNKRESAGHPLPHADQALSLMVVRKAGRGVEHLTAAGLFEPLYNEELARAKERLAAIVKGAPRVPAPGRRGR